MIHGAPMVPRAENDPFVKSRLRLSWQGVELELLAPHSVFASTWIDKGTRLLLDHLPPGEPRTFLDLGCGYGALGLPIAARFPRSRGLLADRDLLAVEYCRRNAEAHGLANVEVAGSLGYRDVPAVSGRFDWILANFPARAGDRVMEYFIAQGKRRLAPGGELRIVVIAPLGPVVERVSALAGLGGRKVIETAQHAVYSFGSGNDEARTEGEAPAEPGEELYLRDSIELALPGLTAPLRLERPTDLADEPHRLTEAIPLLAASLPAELSGEVSGEGRILALRCGYGLIPALALARYPKATVVAVDRDLLGTAFTRRNCAWAGRSLRVAESARVAGAASRGTIDLVIGELSPPLGAAATLAEIAGAREALAPGGQALLLGLASQWRELSKDAGSRLGFQKLSAKGSSAVHACRAP